MTQKQKKIILMIAAFFAVYIFAAARPVPIETILSPRWFTSLESNYPMSKPDSLQNSDDLQLLPFKMGDHKGGHFGYVDKDGNFTINQIRREYGDVSLSRDSWAEYDAIPNAIEVRNPINQTVLKIEGIQGYPFFLDQRIFILHNEGSTLSALNDSGAVVWTYDFAATITVIDAAAGYVLAGLLDGTVEVLNDQGRRVFLFEPGGSRISVILGCAMSRDGSRLAIVSGIDLQRFLLLERYGGDSGTLEYKVIYHEFLEEGFRREVQVRFIDNESRIAFERQEGLGLYETSSRKSLKLPLKGEIKAMDETGSHRMLFLITAQSVKQKRLVAVSFPGTIIMEAPFRSEHSFLGRLGSRVYVGGGMTLASFELEKK